MDIIQQLQDESGNNIMPITKTEAIKDKIGGVVLTQQQINASFDLRLQTLENQFNLTYEIIQ